MIVKATIYFNIVFDKPNLKYDPLYTEILNEKLEDYLSESSFKLNGSMWKEDRIKAKFITRAEAMDLLQSKK